jgi:hypothetical protein
LEFEIYEFCDPAATDPDHWIVDSAQRGWETTRGRPYGSPAPLSGQTDAAVLAKAGIPTVRIGYPFGVTDVTPDDLVDGLGGMGVADVSDLLASCRHLIYMVIDTCTRPRAEILGKTG